MCHLCSTKLLKFFDTLTLLPPLDVVRHLACPHHACVSPGLCFSPGQVKHRPGETQAW